MIKRQNKIIAQKALGMRAKNINGELRSTVARTGSLNCDFERAGIANAEGERPIGALETNEKGPDDLENY